MAIIPGILPPSRETWETVVYVFQFFPLVSMVHTNEMSETDVHCRSRYSNGFKSLV